MLKIIRVRGNCISPYLKDGDFAVLLKSRWIRRALQIGDYVVFTEKQYGVLIKQIESVSMDNHSVMVRGFDDFSIDSRLFGPIQAQQIMGIVLFRIKA